MSLDTALDNFVTAAGQITGISKAYKYEPTRLDVMPAVSLFFIGGTQAPSSTGGWSRIDWLFRCSLTVKVDSLEVAQAQFVTLIPQLFAITRNTPDLGTDIDWADLNDTRQEDPVFIE